VFIEQQFLYDPKSVKVWIMQQGECWPIERLFVVTGTIFAAAMLKL